MTLGDQSNKIDIKERVMGEIKKKKIGIIGRYVVLAEKIGMEGAIAASLLAGAFIISLIFYIFKKTKVLKFFSLGIPGLKVILATIPFGYVALLPEQFFWRSISPASLICVMKPAALSIL